jgi:electron transfer flavoprotein beta subunit
MKILVCITHVPDTTTKIKFDGNRLVTDGVSFVIGPYDDFALARAVEIKEAHKGHVTVLNVGGKDTEPTIRKALAIGADDAVRIDAEPTDGLFVAKQIAEYAKSQDFDMILMGRESSDFNGGQVHGMVAEMLDMPSIVPCMTLDIEGDKAVMKREIEGGHEVLEAGFPFVAGCQEPIAEWKIPNMRGIMQARRKPLQVLEAFDSEKPTEVTSFEVPEGRSECKILEADQVGELVDILVDEKKLF